MAKNILDLEELALCLDLDESLFGDSNDNECEGFSGNDWSDDELQLQLLDGESDKKFSSPSMAVAANTGGPVRSRKNYYMWVTATRKPNLDKFSSESGPTSLVDTVGVDSFLEYFNLIISNKVFQTVILETNCYADQFFHLKGDTLAPHSRAKKWKPVTLAELKKFIGLMIATGLLDKRGSLADYWSTNSVLYTPFFRQTMPRNRFQLILRFLYFNNNKLRSSGNTDKLYKLRPFYNKIIENWRSLYQLGEQISIDEGMLKCRGWLSFRVYQKDKLIKYGIKAYILADSNSGYCWTMDIYHGQEKKDYEKLCLTCSLIHAFNPGIHYIWAIFATVWN